MNTHRTRVADHRARAPSGAYGKLLECCLTWKQRFEPDLLLRIGGEAHAGLPHFAEPLRTQPRERNQALQCEQRLVRRDVGGGLLAADVLLTGLQRQYITALTV